MSIAQRLAFAIGLLVALCVGGASVAVWCARLVDMQNERVERAQLVYEQYLLLSNNAYLLFKQYGDQLVIGDLDGGIGELELARAVQGNIRALRALIASEIALVGDEDIDEMQSLDLIEAKISNITTALEAAASARQSGAGQLAGDSLNEVLDDRIDLDFRAAIDAALAEERREIDEARGRAESALRLDELLSVVFASLALLAALYCGWLVDARVRQPAQRLVDGTRRLSEGDFTARLNVTARDEFGRIAAVIDALAERVEQTTGALAAHNSQLAAAVEQRTRELQTLLEEARRAEAARRQLLADVSHELRTPLTIIRGEADVALRQSDADRESYREALTRARDAATHTARLVDDLLFIARTEVGQGRLVVDTVDLRMLLDDVTRTFATDVPLLSDLTEAPVRADAGRLRQALLVLLENARKHGGRRVILRLDRAPDGYRMAVEDDGPGMSDSEKAVAFERFYRGTNAVDTYREGLGLGLPIARAIAEAHGGRVTLEDRERGGLIAAIFVPSRPTLRAVS